jgi:PPOX class probable F420-dependent enzyme
VIEWPAGARDACRTARVARLATADAAGVPHVVPICFALVGERLYTIVDHKPKRRPASMKRLRNIGENPRVAVLVDRWDEDWSRLMWVMLQGSATRVSGDAEYQSAVVALRAKYPQYRDVTFTPAAHALIGVEIERVIAWRAS